jgi:hypothetical protein
VYSDAPWRSYTYANLLATDIHDRDLDVARDHYALADFS